jgi:DNA-binding transcriptional LysR family regulator
MSLTLRQLEYFTCVAEHGTVTAAGASLHVSQSAVSMAISELERLLDVQLFVRHPRGLALTRDGQSVLSDARRLLRDADNLERHAARMSSELTGSLHVGCYTTIAPLLLPRVLAEFAARHPNVDVHFSEGSRRELLMRVHRAECDVVVMYDYRFEADLAQVGLTTVLGSAPPYAVLPADHRLSGQSSVSLAELAGEPLVLFGLEPADQYFLSLFEAEGVTPDVRFRTTNYEVLRGLVARGLGYSLLTQRTRLTTSYEGLPFAAVELDGDHEPLDVVALTPAGHRLSRRVEAFLALAWDAFRG